MLWRITQKWVNTNLPAFQNESVKFQDLWITVREHISILGPNLLESVTLGQDHQFQVLYSKLVCPICQIL